MNVEVVVTSKNCPEEIIVEKNSKVVVLDVEDESQEKLVESPMSKQKKSENSIDDEFEYSKDESPKKIKVLQGWTNHPSFARYAN